MSPYWLVLVLVAIFAAAILGRSGHVRRPARREPREREPLWPHVEPLRPGESYDNAVKLVSIPNAPLADLWCQRLHEQGIEAFYKSGAWASIPGIYGGSISNPGGPVELWVGEHDAERARQLFPELA